MRSGIETDCHFLDVHNQSWVYKSLMNIPLLKLWTLDIRLCIKLIGLKCSWTDDDYSFPFRKSLISSFLDGKHKFQGFLFGSTIICLKWAASLKIPYGQTMHCTVYACFDCTKTDSSTDHSTNNKGAVLCLRCLRVQHCYCCSSSLFSVPGEGERRRARTAGWEDDAV